MSNTMLANTPSLWQSVLPAAQAGQHKYDRGHVTVAGGPIAQTGAARLAAYGALRAGSGLVTIACDRESLPVYAASLLAVMTRVANTGKDYDTLLSDARRNVFLLGPGMGDSKRTRRLVLRTLGFKKITVLDADALTAFAPDAGTLFSAIKAPCVLTPHEGEFARLFGSSMELSRPRAERAIQAAGISRAVVVLKGHETVIASSDGRIALNTNAPPTLATAGSGDVLAGIIAGLLAQGMPAFEAACAGVWMHGEAANRFGAGLISEDLPGLIPAVWQSLGEKRS